MTAKRPPQLLPRREFILRLGWSLVIGGILLSFSLSIGILGYHWLGKLSWIDSFLDASMILSGMGPISPLHDDSAKLFAGFVGEFESTYERHAT